MTPAEKAKITRAKNKAIKEAIEAERKRKQTIRNKIAYRVRRLRDNVTIFKEDKPKRVKYVKELRALYKEQNPKKNKSYTKIELELQHNFRTLANLQLKNLLNKSDQEVFSMSKKQKR